MGKKRLILQSVDSKDIDQVLNLLTKKRLLKKDNKCPICSKELKKDKIGGFIPHYKKVTPICDSPHCILQASFLVMKHNGNGSPIMER